MNITNKEIHDLLPKDCTPIILDNSYYLPSNAEIFYHVAKFIQYRNLLDELKKELLRGDATDESILSVVKKNLHVEKPFNYIVDANDCDDATTGLLAWLSGLGWACGRAILEGHDVTIIFNDQRNKVFIESQTGEEMQPKTRLKIVVMP